MRLPRGSRAPLPRRRGDGAGLRARLPGGARALPRGDETRKSLNDEPPWRRKARQGPGRGPLTANTGIHAAPRAITRLTPHPRPHTSHRKRHRRQQPPQAPGRGIMVRKVEDGCTYRCSWTPFSSLVYGAQRHLAAAHATGRGRAKFELSHRPDARAALRSPLSAFRPASLPEFLWTETASRSVLYLGWPALNPYSISCGYRVHPKLFFQRHMSSV